MLGVHKKTSNVGTYSETGRLPLCFDGIKLACDYFDRCQNLPEVSLAKKAFKEQKLLNLNWYQNLSSIRSKFSAGNSNVCSINTFQNLRAIFIEKLFLSINESPKLEFYRTVKKEFKFEGYLNCSIPKYRTALTKMRISAHNLEIERGRYTKFSTPQTDRLCRYCNDVHQLKVVESESHVLLDCPLYSKHRNNFCQDIAQSDNKEEGYGGIITENFHVAKFCHKIFKHREMFNDFLENYTE